MERIEKPSMKKQEIISTLQSRIAADILNMPEKTIAIGEPLISSGLIDSFSLVDLAMLIEDIFKVRVDDTELNSDVFDSLDQLAGLILSRIH
jgi:acyl carrier protein